MELQTLFLAIGFAGAWLLFAGPIYQAVLELQDEDIEFDRIRAAGAKVIKPAPISVWWWLLPPIKIYLEFKSRQKQQRRFIDALPKDDLEAIVNYRNKASGWLFVAGGGFLIACKETYELVEHLHWNIFVLIGLIIVMLLISVMNLIFRVKGAKNTINSK